MKITSLTNQKVAYWAKLKMKKYRDIEHEFIVESDHLVNEAIKKGIVKEIITSEERTYDDIPVYEVTESIMERITAMNSAPKVMAVCSYLMPDDIKGKVLVLDRIQDPGNLGTMIRSAIAFGFETIIVSNDTVDMYNDKVIRSSEGMIFNINIVKFDLKEMIPLLKAKKYKVIGTDVKRGKSVKSFRDEKIAIIIGNEGKGLDLNLKEMCDDFIYIPMSKNCESLNAAVAASIIMYEVYNGK